MVHVCKQLTSHWVTDADITRLWVGFALFALVKQDGAEWVVETMFDRELSRPLLSLEAAKEYALTRCYDHQLAILEALKALF